MQDPAPDPIPSEILSPAVIAAQSCPVEEDRGMPIEAPELSRALEGHVPRQLPRGMGLLRAWAPAHGEPDAGAVWADQRCRTLTVRLYARSTGEALSNRWSLVEQRACTNRVLADVPCLEYRAAAADGGFVLVRTVALTPQEAQPVVDSIPVELE